MLTLENHKVLFKGLKTPNTYLYFPVYKNLLKYSLDKGLPTYLSFYILNFTVNCTGQDFFDILKAIYIKRGGL